MMTASVVIAGLLPIMWSSGTGSEVMRRIAAPMIGGMVTTLVLSMFIVPVAYLIVRTWRIRGNEARATQEMDAHPSAAGAAGRVTGDERGEG